MKDLLLTIDSNTFQIDTLIIFANIIHFFEVKNFDGDHLYDEKKDQYYKNLDFEIQNPEHQLSRADMLLRKLFKKHGIKQNLKGTVVFINPEFTLYNVTPDKPFILPTQINALMNNLNLNTQKITNQHKQMAKKIISLHDSNSPINKVPKYSYEELKKGVSCLQCQSLSVQVRGNYCYCEVCGGKEKAENAIIRSVNEYRILFPDEVITTGSIFDWCGGIFTKQRIKRILIRKFRLINKYRFSYYELTSPGM